MSGVPLPPIEQISFAHPWVIVVALVLAAAGVAASATKLTRPPTLVHGSISSLAAPARSWRTALGWVPGAAQIAALLLVGVALARPQSTQRDAFSTVNGVAMQIVIDRSGSMQEPTTLDGREVRRLDAVKDVVRDFIAGPGSASGTPDNPRGREGDLIGLIVFGTYADTLCPLVRDHAALLDILSTVEIPLAQMEQNTSIGDAIALAAARLRGAEDELTAGQRRDPTFRIKSKAIVLLTDGEDKSSEIPPLRAAELARDWGITLYIVGIRGGTTRVMGGQRVMLGNDVDEDEMARAAEITGGRFFPVDEMEDLREVYAAIDAMETTQIEVSDVTQRREHFGVFALAALCLVVARVALGTTVLRRVP
jgi:Ca-activated chloride channel family protein